MTTVDRINCLNIALMVVSYGLAFFFPIELFVLVYALIGPLHFLTEISWLHDRQYFTKRKFDYLLLAIPAIPVITASELGLPNPGLWVAVLIGVVFSVAAVMTFSTSFVGRVVTGIGACIAAGVLSRFPSVAILLSLLLPSLIHLYVFTGFFILTGCLKTRSAWGYVSLLVFIGLGLACMLSTPYDSLYVLRGEFLSRAADFGLQLGDLIQSGLGMKGDSYGFVRAMRFVAFIHLYHYLNWFSKAEVIKWHAIPRQRLVLIGVIYCWMLASLAYDYQVGIILVFTLSMIHVFLEFPLNVRSIHDILTSVRRYSFSQSQ